MQRRRLRGGEDARVARRPRGGGEGDALGRRRRRERRAERTDGVRRRMDADRQIRQRANAIRVPAVGLHKDAIRAHRPVTSSISLEHHGDSGSAATARTVFAPLTWSNSRANLPQGPEVVDYTRVSSEGLMPIGTVGSMCCADLCMVL